jgi:uncharacterized membrane protein
MKMKGIFHVPFIFINFSLTLSLLMSYIYIYIYMELLVKPEICRVCMHVCVCVYIDEIFFTGDFAS